MEAAQHNLVAKMKYKPFQFKTMQLKYNYTVTSSVYQVQENPIKGQYQCVNTTIVCFMPTF